MTAIREVEKLRRNLLQKYPGQFTIFEGLETTALLMSSARPTEAGLTDQIAAVLKEAE